MTTAIRNLERVVEPMREPIREFAELLLEMGGENVKALVLFGSIAAGTFDRERHAARSVLVLEQVDLALLRRLSGEGVRLGRGAIAAPLVMTPPYIRQSLDTFPIELLNIQQQHLALFGEDYFAPLEFADRDLRLQCEREFKSLLIGLRQGLLASAGNDSLIGALEVDASESLVRTLRAMLWLKGIRDAKPEGRALEEIERLTSRKLAGIRRAIDPAGEHDWECYVQLYADVTALGEMVDGW